MGVVLDTFVLYIWSAVLLPLSYLLPGIACGVSRVFAAELVFLEAVLVADILAGKGFARSRVLFAVPYLFCGAAGPPVEERAG